MNAKLSYKLGLFSFGENSNLTSLEEFRVGGIF